VVKDMDFWDVQEFHGSGFEVGDGDDRKTHHIVWGVHR
jgi:hypothetical protein